MRGHVEDISVLAVKPQQLTLYLEKESIPLLISWLDTDHRLYDLVRSKWTIIVFKCQISGYTDYLRRRRRLSKINIKLNDNILSSRDGLFLDEFERTYFKGSGISSRQFAEFYLLVRRCVGNNWANIISQDRAFNRIPLVNTYYLHSQSRTGSTDLPAQFDFFNDFNIHHSLVRSVGRRMDEPNKGNIFFDAIIELRDHIRAHSSLNIDGRPLMEQAFKCDGTHIILNPLTDSNPRSSQQNEQRGYRDIYCGVMTGLRNPLGHEGPSSSFATNRYPDNVKLMKYLSFLSLLFERADGPLP